MSPSMRKKDRPKDHGESETARGVFEQHPIKGGESKIYPKLSGLNERDPLTLDRTSSQYREESSLARPAV